MNHYACTPMADRAYRAVASVLTGDLSFCVDRLLTPDCGRDAISADRLLETGKLATVLERFLQAHEGADRRGAASMWASWYLAFLIPPALASCLLCDRPPALGVQDIALSLAPDGTPDGIQFANLASADFDDPAERLLPLVRGHLVPFVAAVSGLGLSANVLWCNAATYMEWAASILKAQGHALQVERSQIEAPKLADGTPNPLFDRVRTVTENGASVLRRRVCCLRYLMPGLPTCGEVCPLPSVRSAGARKVELRQPDRQG